MDGCTSNYSGGNKAADTSLTCCKSAEQKATPIRTEYIDAALIEHTEISYSLLLLELIQ